ncbi:MAG: glycosyltransferase family 39 protein [Chloroflexi bacterium]|nr:glycosyltransferase family 39 protein [Chloroflexota bacterium]
MSSTAAPATRAAPALAPRLPVGAAQPADTSRLYVASGSLAELLLLGVVLLVAAVVRILFVRAGAPTFVTPDSDDYLWPGYALARGLGFEPELRRTPLYPLFIALVVAGGGNLAGLAVAQHVLGVVTAGLTYGLGRAAFGRLAGVLAGLSIALSGPALVYEHYVMSEALFTCLLAGALLVLVLALRRASVRRPSARWLIGAGVAVGLAALTRPIGQVLYPIALGLPFMLALPRWRNGVQRAGLVLAGLLLVLAPWLVRNMVVHGTPGAEGALGQALIGRTVRHDKRFVYDDPTRPDPDPTRAAARRIIQQEAAGGEPSGGTITARVRDELGLTQAQTNALLRDLALDTIRTRPGYYLTSTAEMAWELFQGKNERLLGHWRERTTRNWDRKWSPQLVSLLDPEAPAEGPAYQRADALVSAFQPWRWRTALGWLFGAGVVAAVVVPRFRPALAPALAAILLVVAAAALDGLVWRFRYPADPAIFVLVGGGLAAPLLLLWTLFRGGTTRWLRR